MTHPFAGDPVFDLHVGGKMESRSTVSLESRDDLSLAYTPGVARVCEAIAADPSMTRHYTWVPNTVAVVTDGTAVLGLGDIGPAAAMPVMEGKAVLFKQFGGVDAVPICLATTDVEEIIETVVRLAPSFGGINLEDISAPRCFEIERRLKELLDIPVFHDDQHGTAVVALAALQNALRLTGRSPSGTRVVIQGAGAAGVAVARILLEAGVRDLAVLDRQGVLHSGRHDLTPVKRALAGETADVFGRSGGLADVMAGADVYIGVSGGTVPEEIVASMADDAIIFGLANPNPEVHPDVAHRHARVVATGRSDFPNQINNVLAFPGIFRGAFDVGASAITEGMKLAAATALAGLVGDDLDRGAHRPVAVRPPRRTRRGSASPRPPAPTGSRRADLVVTTGTARASAPALLTETSTAPGRAPVDRVAGMFAVYAESFSSEDPLSGLVVGERPEPEVPDGWTTVTVKAAALNHHDLWTLRGVGIKQEQLPMIVGCDAAGVDEDGNEVVVHAVISSPGFAGGDETLDPKRSLLSERYQGTFADKVTVPRANVIAKPASLSFEEASCLPTAWLTAYRMLYVQGGCKPGDTVLVQGAGGGVATALIALARAGGLKVLATSRDESKRQRALELGAHEVYETGERLPVTVDAVMETVGQATWLHSIRSLRVGGTLVTSGATSGNAPADMGLTRIFFLQLKVVGSTMGTRGELASLTSMLDATGVRPVIDRVLPMEDAREGFAAMRDGDVFGKVVFTR